MALPNNPQTRREQYLAKAAGQSVSIPDEPLTREESYLDKIARGGGGGGGTTDYEDLSNKPTLNNVTLDGELSLSDLGIQGELEAGDNITIEDGVISAKGGGEVVEMTYAQYQALTPQQKMDGTVRYVNDYPSGGGGGGGSSYDFSTTEVRTGQKWINGEDIYERVYKFTAYDLVESTVSSSAIRGHYLMDIEDYQDYEAIWIDLANSFIYCPNRMDVQLSTPIEYDASQYLIRCNIQQHASRNNGEPTLYIEVTYAATTLNTSDNYFCIAVKSVKKANV